MSNLQLLKTSLESDVVKDKFTDMLGKKAPGFISSIISSVSTNPKLLECDPNTIIASAAVAASIDLPIIPSLGYSYIVPYAGKAQFQMGYKGLIQLAMRTGQYRTINALVVFEGELRSVDKLTGFVDVNGEKESNTVIGYLGYFKMLNGFEKMLYMTVEEMDSHGARYSKTFNKESGLWKKDPEVMGKKTVLKLLLSKYGFLSIEMQTAVETDQGVVTDAGIEYPDAKEQRSFDDQEPVEARIVDEEEASE